MNINYFEIVSYYLNCIDFIYEDGIIEYGGTKYCYKNNKLHREDGPALEYYNGDKYWCKNGSLHREYGPAIEYADGEKHWYLNNICYGKNNDFTNESWQKFIKTLIFS